MAADTGKGHFLAGKTVFIAGAGLSGTAFAASLRKLWTVGIPPPKVVIFDRDQRHSVEQRGGYSLSLVGHDLSGGLNPLKKLGLLESVLYSSISGADGKGSFTIWSSEWKELSSFQKKPINGIPTSSLRISRNGLRQILTKAAVDDPNEIEWNSQCVSTKRLSNGRLEVGVLRGESGIVEELECDLLIAADGAQSKLRSCLRPDDTLDYTGAVLRGGVATFDVSIPPQIGRNWGFVMSRTGVSCFVSPVDEKSVLWAVGQFEAQAPPRDKTSECESQDIVKQALQLTSHIQEPLHTIINNTDLNTVMRLNASDKMPFRHDDSLADAPVVFMGDSNHALSPFAGYGANLGLNDAWDLAEKLVTHGSIQAAVVAYDDVSVPRATKVLLAARKRLKAGHSTGALYFVFMFALALRRFFSWVAYIVRGR